MKKFYILFSISFLLFSCGSAPTVRTSKTISDSYPEVGKETSANIGQSMVLKEKGGFYESITINKDVGSGRFSKNVKLKKGQVLILKGETKDQWLYYTQEIMVSGAAFPKDGSEPKYFTGSPYGNTYSDFSEPLEYTKSTSVDPQSLFFKQEFIFNGKSGNSLKFTYREYADNTARPAFAQDLQYDLSEGREIGFKDMLIEVIEATNTYIKYKVTKPL